MSSLVTEVCRLLNTKKVSATAYHPQTNGLVEWFNNTFVEAISTYVSTNQGDWDLYIPAILFAFRVLPSVSTGNSPFYLLYGRNARFPCDTSLLLAIQLSPSVEEHGSRIVKQIEFAKSLARSNIARSQQLNKLQYDKTALDAPFAIGQHVWIYTPNVMSGLSKKFLARLYDPYRICCQLCHGHYQFPPRDNRLVATTVHANRLKPFYDPADQPILPPPNDEQDVILLEEHDLPVGSCEPDDTTPDSTDPNTHSQETSIAVLLIFQINLLTLMCTKLRKYSSLASTEAKFSTLSSGLTTSFQQYLGA